MLPCQSQCPSYHSGCHKSCACWKAFQERQRLQRQAKKKYLKFYGALCAQSLRQLTAGQSRRPAWGLHARALLSRRRQRPLSAGRRGGAFSALLYLRRLPV